MKIAYIQKTFQQKTQDLINAASSIIEEYAAQGFVLTVRQLHYQFVARAIYANTERNYRRMCSIINDARLAGLIDWESIADRTRFLRDSPYWGSPRELLTNAVDWYSVDMWQGQPYHPEVWIEKDALIDVVGKPCSRLQVPYFSCRGYVSQSAMWEAAQRLRGYEALGQEPVVLHLGDHDPSGIDMTRDIQDRLSLFGVRSDTVVRLGLTMKQVESCKPPPNPVKITDSRCSDYVERYGPYSWELDALDPTMLARLVEDAILYAIDASIWGEVKKREQEGKRVLKGIVDGLEIK